MPAAGKCPPPLESSDHGCDAPPRRVLVPAASIVLGPSDWEAEGRVTARTINVEAFRIDAFEVTSGRFGLSRGDTLRAASGMTRHEAAAFCARDNGRLPSEDEWIAAAASGASPPRRYPWGDTGAVCRRAAWALEAGPCAKGADGPDTVGAHAEGDSALGLHDLSGNVAEWVAPGSLDPRAGVAMGGSWRSTLVAELRIWARLELDPGIHDPRIGVRCVYPP
jgi:formylglycine-generating enzyme required for sulfatase activity